MPVAIGCQLASTDSAGSASFADTTDAAARSDAADAAANDADARGSDAAKDSPVDAEAGSAEAGSADASIDASDAGDGGLPEGSTGHVVSVSVGGSDGFSFDPPQVTVHVGDSVAFTWTNGRHNVVSGTVVGGLGVADQAFCSPGAATCGDSTPLRRAPFAFQHTFLQEGDFPYFCVPHASFGMTGVVHVAR